MHYKLHISVDNSVTDLLLRPAGVAPVENEVIASFRRFSFKQCHESSKTKPPSSAFHGGILK